MSYLFKSAAGSPTIEGDLLATSSGSATLYSRFLNDQEAQAILDAYRSGKLKDYLHAYQKHYFLAILVDASDTSVHLINDKFGSNHLFYLRRGETLWVSDDLQRLYGALGEKPIVDPAAAYEVLDLYTVCPPRTIFTGLEAVPMGNIICFSSAGEATTERYWDVRRIFSEKAQNYDEFVVAFRKAFLDSLKAEYVKGKTGVALSGGIDSGGILAMLSDIAKEPLPSISFGPHGETSGDLISARASAKESGSSQTLIYPSLADIARLPDMIEGINQPFAFDVFYPNAMIFETARSLGLKKVAYGYGSEMLLGNLAMGKYAYKLNRVERLIPRFLLTFIYRAYVRYKGLSKNQLEILLTDSWSRRFLQVRGPLFSREKYLYKRLPKDFLATFTPELDSFVREMPLGDAIARMYLSTWENYTQWHDTGTFSRKYGIECIMPFNTPEVAEVMFHATTEIRRLMDWDKKAIRDMFKPFITERMYHTKGKSLVIPYTKLLAPVHHDLIDYLETSPIASDLVDLKQYREQYSTLPEPGLNLIRLTGIAVWYDVNWNRDNLPNWEKAAAILRSR